jgi:hypothetical protein
MTQMDRNQTTRPAPALVVDVPSAISPGNNHNDFVTQAFVGSPEQTDDSERTPPSRPRSCVENANHRIPSLQVDQRSFSFPHVAQLYSTRSDTTQRNSRFIPSIRRHVSGRPSPGDHQWTLFGQVMENELRGSRVRRHPQHVLSPSESRSGYFPASSGLEDGEVQSPVADFPPCQDDLSEDDYDSDTSRISHTMAPLSADPTPRWCSVRRLPTLSNLHRSIIKCVIAYFIASLFTFAPYLSGFVSDITSDNEPGDSRPSPAGHMVATV